MRTIIVRDINTTVADVRQRPRPTEKQMKIISDILLDVRQYTNKIRKKRWQAKSRSKIN